MTKLSKFLAQSGFCSRRAATELIKDRKVKVNGVLVTEPYHEVVDTDFVKVGNKRILPEQKLYFLFNKPQDVICTLSDTQGRDTIAHHFAHIKQRLYPIGRLDRNTTGLIIMTNDGDLAQRLSHPKFNIPKTYHVTTHRPVTAEDLQRLREGVMLDDGFMKVDEAILASKHSPKTVIVTIHSGRNHIIKRLFGALRFFVKKLDRSSFAGLSKKSIKVGGYRALTEKEIEKLKSI
ncbi:rRNA pseudouridine synthase [Candidatus Babeliales bacterium]|nr:rRNA pseudouridine synthase [Candidatus Babeliales bacterium]